MKGKILLTTILLTGMMLMISGCSGGADKENSSQDASSSKEEITEQEMSITEFEELLSEQPLAVISTKYIVQDEQYKSIYPDMLQAIVQNNTTEDIKNAVVAFVAWDSNSLPVKIKGQFDFGETTYLKQVNYSDINLIGGDTYGQENGYSLDENCQIATFKAIAVSFETFDGDTWENPYYDEFQTLYEGKKYSDDMRINVKIEKNDTFNIIEKTEEIGELEESVDSKSNEVMTADELEANLAKQPITVINTKYVVQSDRYKSLYPDVLQVIIQNNTTEDIKNAVVAFVAWDKNNLPVKIEGKYDFRGGSYVKEVSYLDINLVGGDTFGENSGFELAENNGIVTFKAMVISYETFEGETWESPYYDDFCALYEGKKLN